MIDEPPFTVGAVQVIPITEALDMAGLLLSAVGGSGLVKITALLPAAEVAELPTTFVAITVAQTLEPQARL